MLDSYFCRTVYSVFETFLNFLFTGQYLYSGDQRIVIFVGQYTVWSKHGDQRIIIFVRQYTVWSKHGDQRIVIFAGQHTVWSKRSDQSPSRLQQLLWRGMSWGSHTATAAYCRPTWLFTHSQTAGKGGMHAWTSLKLGCACAVADW